MADIGCGNPVFPGSRRRPAVAPKPRQAERAVESRATVVAAARARRLATAAGGVLAAILVATPWLALPFGRMRDPLALVLVLPPLAVALERFGWSHVVAGRIRSLKGGVRRALVAYVASLVTSALLTLDVAAVAAASVGIATAGSDAAERDVQVGSAIVGSNAGSLLFPFSNLTNLVLLAGAGVTFRAYVGAALLPQLEAAVAIGVVLAWRARRTLGRGGAADTPTGIGATAVLESGVGSGTVERRTVDFMARVAGTIAVVGALAAVVAGFAGGDVPLVFAVTSALVSGLAVASGRATVRELAGSVPLPGIAVIAAAAALSGGIAVLARSIPVPIGHLSSADLVWIALVGGVLAAGLNNLPAAAFGAVWLRAAGPVGVIAYLVGTNVIALVTPHGSLATMLCRSVASRAGHEVPVGPYVRAAWRYALAGGLAALLPLVLLSATSLAS